VTARICVSILPKNNLEALTLIKRAEKANADLVEVRLDYFETSRRLSELVKSTKLPLIATNKLQSENGFFAGTETQRQQTLLNAAKNGFAYVDVNLSSPNQQETIQKLALTGAQPIVSYHKFDGALNASEMEKVLQEEIASGASVCKIVTTAKKAEDNLSMLNFVFSNSSKAKLVCFCMGEQGKVSRLLSPMFGAYFTFASLNADSETAAGQITIQEMIAAFNILGAYTE
jgi:3-dehydroquinate dehydratase type I